MLSKEKTFFTQREMNNSLKLDKSKYYLPLVNISSYYSSIFLSHIKQRFLNKGNLYNSSNDQNKTIVTKLAINNKQQSPKSTRNNSSTFRNINKLLDNIDNTNKKKKAKFFFNQKMNSNYNEVIQAKYLKHSLSVFKIKKISLSTNKKKIIKIKKVQIKQNNPIIFSNIFLRQKFTELYKDSSTSTINYY